MAARAGGLLPVEYFHVVFTLPAEFAQAGFRSKKTVQDLLFRASAETVKSIAADPWRLGAKAGTKAVLHSWGSALTDHPHIHMIVPGGGLGPTDPAGSPAAPAGQRRRGDRRLPLERLSHQDRQ